MAEEIGPLRPQPGPQTRFLSSPADVVIYGGGAGGGKSFALLLEPLRHAHVPGFGATIFRRTYPRITAQGGMWDESRLLYPTLGARPNKSDLSWHFPSGATVKFAHLQSDDTVHEYHGSQIALLCFDELTEFSERQFWYMFSRNRSACGVRPYIRATCNPDADSWVAALIAWWIDQESGLAIAERSGVVRWFMRLGDDLQWGASREELVERYGAQAQPKSLTFIPASVYDNPKLLAKDPGYIANLMALTYVDQQRLLGGNWKIKPEAGKVFNRAWFEIDPGSRGDGQAGTVECRGWDFAATAKKLRGDDPDFTAGVKMRKVDGLVIVRDCVADQVGPVAGDDLLVNTSVQDALACREAKVKYMIRWEQDPGQAAIKESRRLVGLLQVAFTTHNLLLDAQGVPVHGDKLTRAAGLASAAKVGNVRLEAGSWNEMWLRHMHSIPDGPHDDIMDGSSTAFNALNQVGTKRTAESYQG
jgi:predicted phage terminase large subunit-like protein